MEARDRLSGAACDVCVAFASGTHVAEAEATLAVIGETLEPAQAIGCAASGVLADGREIERDTGVSVWAASLNGASATAFRCERSLPDLDGADGAVLLADPRDFPADALLPSLPGVPVLGGLASAGDAALFLDGEALRGGAVGLRFDGVDIVACVSQGAAPLGPELTITAAEGNVILELAGRPAYAMLQKVAEQLPAEEQTLLERSGGVLLGIVVEANKPEYVQGDFLVRPVIGADTRTGAVAVGAMVRPGQVVRLHARDAASADRDLRRALDSRSAGFEPAGALVFACNGRGTGMFGVPDHDALAVAQGIGGAPSAGFFAAGEIGPVGSETFLHGFTATVALFGHALTA
ncbi:MAG: hypothetical protein QOI80_3489 [Solirubrobacteraceae bacterium]|nr:hypothetical protein [Solirubrobacteraceae bacterium]